MKSLSSFSLPELRRFFKKFALALNPMPIVGGLEISEQSLRFAAFRDQQLFSQALRLTPGMIAQGKIQDKKNFVLALQALRSKIEPAASKPVYIVAVLPSAAVYSQVFSLPALQDERLTEALALNLSMLSPIPAERAYMSSEQLTYQADAVQVDVLGAFSERGTIDEFLSALAEANFVVTALEFPALATVRLLAKLAPTEPLAAELVFQAIEDGFTIMILRNNSLYFSRFVSWASLREETHHQELTEADFTQAIKKELQQVLNFYTSHWGGALQGVVIVAEQLQDKVTDIVQTTFALPTKTVTIKEFPGLSSVWWPSLGAAFRGLIPRSQDTSLSLTPSSVRAHYWRDRLLLFVNLWKKMMMFSFGFILIIFIGVDVFLIFHERRVSVTPILHVPAEQLAQSSALQIEAVSFNALLSMASQAKESAKDWRPIFVALEKSAKNLVALRQISFSDDVIALEGSASTQASLINFKNKLIEEKCFQDVTLPLSSLRTLPDNSVGFKITLLWKCPAS